ncbi:MAG: hypothetical protein IPI78_18840 [Chitinophagaceae bacterium]|nr:hypothetical protein [Chitinophagaceae bacterium]
MASVHVIVAAQPVPVVLACKASAVLAPLVIVKIPATPVLLCPYTPVPGS